MKGYFHQKIKVVLMDVIGSTCVWKRRCDWSTHSAASWESYSIFTCELVWKISGLNLVWNFSYMKFFIYEIGVNFLSGMFNLVPHVKFLICIHFKHVSGVNQVWNRPDLMRIFCTGMYFPVLLYFDKSSLLFLKHISSLFFLYYNYYKLFLLDCDYVGMTSCNGLLGNSLQALSPIPNSATYTSLCRYFLKHASYNV